MPKGIRTAAGQGAGSATVPERGEDGHKQKATVSLGGDGEDGQAGNQAHVEAVNLRVRRVNISRPIGDHPLKRAAAGGGPHEAPQLPPCSPMFLGRSPDYPKLHATFQTFLGSPLPQLNSPRLMQSPRNLPLFQPSPKRGSTLGAQSPAANQFNMAAFETLFSSPVYGSGGELDMAFRFLPGLDTPSTRVAQGLQDTLFSSTPWTVARPEAAPHTDASQQQQEHDADQHEPCSQQQQYHQHQHQHHQQELQHQHQHQHQHQQEKYQQHQHPQEEQQQVVTDSSHQSEKGYYEYKQDHEQAELDDALVRSVLVSPFPNDSKQLVVVKSEHSEAMPSRRRYLDYDLEATRLQQLPPMVAAAAPAAANRYLLLSQLAASESSNLSNPMIPDPTAGVSLFGRAPLSSVFPQISLPMAPLDLPPLVTNMHEDTSTNPALPSPPTLVQLMTSNQFLPNNPKGRSAEVPQTSGPQSTIPRNHSSANEASQSESGDSQHSALPLPQLEVSEVATRKRPLPGGLKTCHCKKSQCLKLYCDCFAAGSFCSGCSCSNCMNRPENASAVNDKREYIMQRDPEAFTRKIQADDDKHQGRHKKGCNCRRSHCLKKYCECYQGGVKCNDLCKCMECLNIDESGPMPSRASSGRAGNPARSSSVASGTTEGAGMALNSRGEKRGGNRGHLPAATLAALGLGSPPAASTQAMSSVLMRTPSTVSSKPSKGHAGPASASAAALVISAAEMVSAGTSDSAQGSQAASGKQHGSAAKGSGGAHIKKGSAQHSSSAAHERRGGGRGGPAKKPWNSSPLDSTEDKMDEGANVGHASGRQHSLLDPAGVPPVSASLSHLRRGASIAAAAAADSGGAGAAQGSAMKLPHPADETGSQGSLLRSCGSQQHNSQSQMQGCSKDADDERELMQDCRRSSLPADGGLPPNEQQLRQLRQQYSQEQQLQLQQQQRQFQLLLQQQQQQLQAQQQHMSGVLPGKAATKAFGASVPLALQAVASVSAQIHMIMQSPSPADCTADVSSRSGSGEPGGSNHSCAGVLDASTLHGYSRSGAPEQQQQQHDRDRAAAQISWQENKVPGQGTPQQLRQLPALEQQLHASEVDASKGQSEAPKPRLHAYVSSGGVHSLVSPIRTQLNPARRSTPNKRKASVEGTSNMDGDANENRGSSPSKQRGLSLSGPLQPLDLQQHTKDCASQDLHSHSFAASQHCGITGYDASAEDLKAAAKDFIAQSLLGPTGLTPTAGMHGSLMCASHIFHGSHDIGSRLSTTALQHLPHGSETVPGEADCLLSPMSDFDPGMLLTTPREPESTKRMYASEPMDVEPKEPHRSTWTSSSQAVPVSSP